MAKRCKTGKCRTPRASWWKQSLGVDWFNSGVASTPEYEAYIAYLQDNAITEPTSAEKTALNTLLNSAKSAGLLSKMKAGYVHGIGEVNVGTVNIKDPATYRKTAQGTTPTYTYLKGTKSAGAGSCWNTNFAVNEYSGIESDLTLIVDVYDGGASSTSDRLCGSVLTANTAHRLQLNTGSRSAFSSVTTNFTNPDSRGCYALKCDGTNNIIIKDKVKQSVAATPVTPTLANDILLLAYNTSSTGGVTVSGTTFTKNVTSLFIFEQLTDEEVNEWMDIFETFKREVYYTETVWYVQPAGGTYGTEDGTSFANAFDGDADVAWTQLGMGHTLYLSGTFNEQFTVETGRITLDGDHPDHPGTTINGQDTRANCVLVSGISYATVKNMTLINATTNCLGLFGPATGLVIEDVECSGSGNQGVQLEGNGFKIYATLTRVNSHDNTDDGFSHHGGAVTTHHDCEAYNNSQGVHSILDAVAEYNDSYIHDNTTNVQADATSDLTFNNCTFENGPLINSSSVPIKLNNCTLTNAALTGTFIIDGVEQTF